MNDASPSCLLHRRNEGLGEIPRRSQLLVEVFVPLLVASLEERSVQPPSSVAYVDVDSTKAFLCTDLHFLHDSRIRRLAHDDDRLGPQGPRLRLDRLRLVEITPGIDDDVGATTGELQQDRSTDVPP